MTGWEMLLHHFVHKYTICTILGLSSAFLNGKTFGFRVSKLFVAILIWPTGELAAEQVFHFMAQENAHPDEHANTKRACACVRVSPDWNRPLKLIDYINIFRKLIILPTVKKKSFSYSAFDDSAGIKVYRVKYLQSYY
jgi:hypothetical protein